MRLYASMGSYEVSFEITAAGAAGTTDRSAPFQFRLDVDARHSGKPAKPALTFSTFTREAFVSMAMLLVERRETNFRDWLQRNYDHMVWKRRHAQERDQAARAAKQRQAQLETEALLAARERALEDAIAGIQRADHIRSLALALGKIIGQDSVLFDRWKSWALAKANSLDIRTRSPQDVDAWLSDFRLSSEDAG